MEPWDFDREEMSVGVDHIIAKGMQPISQLPPCIPPRKPTTKVSMDPNSMKFNVFTLFLLEEVPIHGELLA